MDDATYFLKLNETTDRIIAALERMDSEQIEQIRTIFHDAKPRECRR